MEETKILQNIYQIVFDIEESNVEHMTQLSMQYYDKDLTYSFNTILCHFIYSAFIAKKNEINLYFQYLKEIENTEEKILNQNPKTFEVFKQFLLIFNTCESNYILNQMLERKLIQPDFIFKTTSSPYFVHYMTKMQFEKMSKYFTQFTKYFFDNKQKLCANNWELHKHLIHEGVNPSEIAKVIREDDVEELQKLSSQTDFNFKQKIEPSLYERFSFINNWNVSLIDYAAFFGSIKCFRFLMLNTSITNRTIKYAIAGGNIEIYHLCENNEISFSRFFDTIKFHQNQIFHYFYQNNTPSLNDLYKLGIKCIALCNFEIFSFLLNEGMKINEKFFCESVKFGNIFPY